MKFKRNLPNRAILDLVPMIDVILWLLLFFLVSTTFADLPGIKLDLPKSSTAETTRTNGITITVESGGKLFVNSKAVQIDGLDAALNALPATSSRNTIPVSLEADETVPSGMIVQILDSLRRTGYTGVNLRTRAAGQ